MAEKRAAGRIPPKMLTLQKFLLTTVVCLCVPPILLAQSGTAEVRLNDLRSPDAGEDPQIDRALWAILQEWEVKTKRIVKLSGKHRRFVYDQVFEVEKRADGKFYYESPDKGRIDIEVVPLGKNEQSQKVGKSGKPFEVKSDLPEIWICDGKKIAQANVQEKTYSVFNLPPENQGQNIMDGPLPFLFGLPAEVAAARYHITLLPETNEKFVWLRILPKRHADALNWSLAEVILVRDTFLPYAVKMVDPPGNRETVYRFEDLKANGISIPILGADPFNISKVLRGYREVKSGDQEDEGLVQQPRRPPAGPIEPASARPRPTVPEENVIVKPPASITMPDVSNYPWKTLKKFFEEKGFKVEFRKANPAPTPEQIFAIADQHPKAGEPLELGQTVTFWLYDEIKTAEKR
jgi:TIGR03009 family protein